MVEMDVAHDLFRVTPVDRDAPTEEALLGAIRELGFKPRLSNESLFESAAPKPPTGEPPEVVRAALARARAERKWVLARLVGDNCVACTKMSTATFGHPDVRKLLEERFIAVEINVDHQKEAAAWFGGSAIPDTSIFSAEGTLLDRVVGFEAPEAFLPRLRKSTSGK